jgi:sec-independent protein translocase protein TatA
MHTLKNASSDLKHEITKSAKEQGMDDSAATEIKEEIQKVKDDLEDFTGSIKRNI